MAWGKHGRSLRLFLYILDFWKQFFVHISRPIQVISARLDWHEMMTNFLSPWSSPLPLFFRRRSPLVFAFSGYVELTLSLSALSSGRVSACLHLTSSNDFFTLFHRLARKYRTRFHQACCRKKVFLFAQDLPHAFSMFQAENLAKLRGRWQQTSAEVEQNLCLKSGKSTLGLWVRELFQPWTAQTTGSGLHSHSSVTRWVSSLSSQKGQDDLAWSLIYLAFECHYRRK